MFEVDASVGHRLLAPRIAYVIGSQGSSGPDMAPVSNLTSVSRSPQALVIAVFKDWQTHANLLVGHGFTVSVPASAQNDAVWKLGEKYSGFTPSAGHSKIDECGTVVDMGASDYGPVLADAIGWLDCRIIGRGEIESDHGIFFGGVTRSYFNEQYLDEEGWYLKNSQPVMQVVGNTFATSTDGWSNEYF